MKTWDSVKDSITSLNESEKKEIEFEAQLIAQIINRRNELGWSQRDLEDKTGVKQSAIARLEKLKNSPNLNTIFKLLEPLGLGLEIMPKR